MGVLINAQNVDERYSNILEPTCSTIPSLSPVSPVPISIRKVPRAASMFTS